MAGAQDSAAVGESRQFQMGQAALRPLRAAPALRGGGVGAERRGVASCTFLRTPAAIARHPYPRRALGPRRAGLPGPRADSPCPLAAACPSGQAAEKQTGSAEYAHLVAEVQMKHVNKLPALPM